MAVLAGKPDLTTPADTQLFIASTNANVDLQAVSGKPRHAAQRVEFINGTGAGILVTYTPEGSIVPVAVTVPANYVWSPGVHVKSLSAGGGACQAMAYWWALSSCDFNR